MGLFGDFMGTSMKAKFPSYANKEHLHPRERIRLFLTTETSEKKIQDDAVDWIDTTREIFRFSRETDPRGELVMYAVAACARAAFLRIGTARAELPPGDSPWRIELIFFRREVQRAPVHFDIYLGSSGINYYPGFPKQIDINPPVEAAMQGTQREMKFRRYANKATGQISYVPLYDHEEPIAHLGIPPAQEGWESKLT